MAYGSKYHYEFLSDNGTDYEIFIQKNGYSGDILDRALGQAPVLKRENNGCICGTSLEIWAECKVDGEYAEFYTSNPFEFKVLLYHGHTLIWSGFISTEIFSEPDIAPPYDVQIIAVDGLGELKFSDYDGGMNTLRDTIEGLLEKTGMVRPLNTVSSIAVTAPTSAASDDILDSAYADFAQFIGSSCYDALQGILESLHAMLTVHHNEWLLVRLTDLTSDAAYKKANGTTAYGEIATYGAMRWTDWWPVGQLTKKIDPAKNKVEVVSDLIYVDAMKNPDMETDASWAKHSGATYGTVGRSREEGYVLPNASAYVDQLSVFRTNLQVEAKCVISGYFGGRLAVAPTMKVQILREDSDGNFYYLKSQLNQDESVSYVWTSDASFILVSSTSLRVTNYEIPIPITQTDNADNLLVGFYGNANWQTCVTKCSVTIASEEKGSKDIADIQNGARSAADSVTSVIPRPSIVEDAGGLISGILYDHSGTGWDIITKVSTSHIASADLLQVIALDYAFDYVLPRRRMSGTLNVPVDTEELPMIFRDFGDLDFWPETYSWDMLHDELQVDLVSLPPHQLDHDWFLGDNLPMILN